RGVRAAGDGGGRARSAAERSRDRRGGQSVPQRVSAPPGGGRKIQLRSGPAADGLRAGERPVLLGGGRPAPQGRGAQRGANRRGTAEVTGGLWTGRAAGAGEFQDAKCWRFKAKIEWRFPYMNPTAETRIDAAV